MTLRRVRREREEGREREREKWRERCYYNFLNMIRRTVIIVGTSIAVAYKHLAQILIEYELFTL